MFLQEIHYRSHAKPMFVSITLGQFPEALTNSTRFQLWQPHHEGIMAQAWAIDNMFIGGSPITPNVLYDTFDGLSPAADAWVDWPSGQLGHLCDE